MGKIISRSLNNDGIGITWFGHAMFLIESPGGARIAIDPYDAETGYKPPHIKADAVTLSHHHHDHDNVQALDESTTVIDKPGSYSVKDIMITGIPSFHDDESGAKRGENIIFKFECGGLTVVHMGDFGQALTDEQGAFLSGADIVMMPVGGTYTIDYRQAAEIARRINPKVVIPMHFKTALYEGAVDTVDPFLAQMSIVRRKGVNIMVKQTDLPLDTEVWVMEYMQ